MIEQEDKNEVLPDFSLMIAAVDANQWKITKETTAQDKPARWTVRENSVVYAESYTMRRAVAEAMKRKEGEKT